MRKHRTARSALSLTETKNEQAEGTAAYQPKVEVPADSNRMPELMARRDAQHSALYAYSMRPGPFTSQGSLMHIGERCKRRRWKTAIAQKIKEGRLMSHLYTTAQQWSISQEADLQGLESQCKVNLATTSNETPQLQVILA